MRILDITVGLTPTLPVWPGEAPIRIERVKSIGKGDPANVSVLSGGVHTATHVDAPSHFLDGGKSVEDLPLEALIGPAWVAYLPGAKAVGPRELSDLEIPSDCTRLLLKTSNSDLWKSSPSTFEPDYAALTREGAAWIVQRGIELIGIDYLSIQLYADPEPVTHRTLLGAGVVVVEGLNLAGIAAGWYHLVCLPMKLVGSDGAPVRAVLISD